jgi:hypothetical protein
VGYYVVEARWECEDLSARRFFELDTSPVVGDLDAAKATAQLYFYKHVASRMRNGQLQWLAGDPDDRGPIYYANNSVMTLRIRQ